MHDLMRRDLRTCEDDVSRQALRIMLAASSLPPLTPDANRHRPTPAHPGSATAASNAAWMAATANPAASADGASASPPNSTASGQAQAQDQDQGEDEGQEESQ